MHGKLNRVFKPGAAGHTYLVYFLYERMYSSLYVTVFWKTDHIDTKTEIHLLPVRDRHTHALSRNTKH